VGDGAPMRGSQESRYDFVPMPLGTLTGRMQGRDLRLGSAELRVAQSAGTRSGIRRSSMSMRSALAIAASARTDPGFFPASISDR
jgi:hypothetical protein